MAVVRMNITIPEKIAKKFRKEFSPGERSAAITEAVELVLAKKTKKKLIEDLIADYKMRASETTDEIEEWDQTLADGIDDED